MIILTQMNLCLSSLSLKTPRLKGKVEMNIQVKKCQKANFFLPWLAHRCKLGSYSWNWSRGGISSPARQFLTTTLEMAGTNQSFTHQSCLFSVLPGCS